MQEQEQQEQKQATQNSDKGGELPLYKLALEFMLLFMKYAKDVSKFYRYALVEKVCDQQVEVLSYLYLASMTSDKLEKRQYLLLSKQQMAKVVIEVRLLHDIGALGSKHFIQLAQKSDEIGRQLFKWDKALVEKYREHEKKSN